MAQRVLSSAWKLIPGILLAYSVLWFFIHIFRSETRSIMFSPDETGTWVFIYIIVPFLFGLFTRKLFYKVWLPSKRIVQIFGLIWLTTLLVALVVSKSYWNYFIKRPGVFYEAAGKKEIRTFFRLDNIDYSVPSGRKNLEFRVDTLDLEELKNTPKFYYQFLVRSIHRQDEMLENSVNNQSLTKTQVRSIEKQITQAGILDSTGPPVYGFTGTAISFTRKNQAFLLLTIRGVRAVSNDHYYISELLFKQQGEDYILNKHQKFYFDIAGMEHTEFSTMLPFMALFLLCLLVPVLVISEILSWKKSKKQASI